MSSREIMPQRMGDKAEKLFLRRKGLQVYMTVSYIKVTLICIFLLEVVCLIVFLILKEPLRNLHILKYVSIVSLLLFSCIGGLFGLIASRSLVGRVQSLVRATQQFAAGNYGQRVRVSREDEIGQLELYFNSMAEQLSESIAQREMLAEENARLTERARISRELHDAISQDLFSLRMLSNGLHMALPEDSALHPQVTTLEQTTTNMIREMRALLLEMRPPQLGQLGFAKALTDLASTYCNRLGITVKIDIAPVILSAQYEQTLFRIAQEALSNAVRHAEATLITISLIAQEQVVVLVIEDNGKGFFREENTVQHGLGLRLMYERVQELHGEYEVESAPGKGTRIRICLAQEGTHDTCLDYR